MGKAIVYATGLTKNTKNLAQYISRKAGTDIFNLKELSKLDLSSYDTVIFGTGVHAGKPYKQVTEFIENNRDALNGKKLYLFISCMYNDEKGDNQCEKIATDLGIPDAVYFNKKAEEMNEDGFPVAVDDFIARL